MISIFFDMDGVLADFVAGALEIHNRTDVPKMDVPWGLEDKLGIAPHDFWAPMGKDFWANLPPLSDGLKLLEYAEWLAGIEAIGILTSPCDTAGCYDGKRAWMRKHLPRMERRMFTGSHKELFAGPTKILIDDREQNCHGFYKAGGIPILVPRPWNGLRYQCGDEGTFSVTSQVPILEGSFMVAGGAVRNDPPSNSG